MLGVEHLPHKFSPPGVFDGEPANLIYGNPKLSTKSDKQRMVAALDAMGLIPGDLIFKSGQTYQSNLSHGQQDEARRMCNAVDKLDKHSGISVHSK